MIKNAILALLLLLALASCRSAGPEARTVPDSSRFYVHLGKGVGALERKDYAEAIRFLRLAVEARPGSTKALNLRGVACFMSGRIREARADFERVIGLDADYEAAYGNLGCALVKEGDLAGAEAVLRRALGRFPASAAVHFTLGSVLVFQHRPEEALAVMRRGLELDPDYFKAERKFTAESDLPGTDRGELFFSYARLFAAAGDVGRTVENLRLAKKAGFRDWQRLRALGDFDPVRADPALEEFLK